MTELNGLENITSVAGLEVEGNTSLTSVMGLNGLQSITNSLYISNNPTLEEINGFDSLTEISNSLIINSNAVLSSVEGFNNLINIVNLDIRLNDNLSDISFVESLESISNQLIIKDNPSLSSCSYNSICQHISEGGTVDISNNATGCNSPVEITDTCSLNVADIYSKSYTLYPNPADNEVTIHYEGEISNVQIWDLLGNIVLESSAATLNIANLKSGLYLVSIQSVSGDIDIEKLIIH